MEEWYYLRKKHGRIKKAEKECRGIFDDTPEECKRKVREINRDRLRGDYEAAEAIVDELYAGEYADLWSQLDMADFERRSERGEEMLPSDLYRNTAGEIEARDAAARRNLTAEQRAAGLNGAAEHNISQEAALAAGYDGADRYVTFLLDQGEVYVSAGEPQNIVQVMVGLGTVYYQDAQLYALLRGR